MLEQSYPSKRPKPILPAPVVSILPYNSSTSDALARRYNCTVGEFRRRDAIVRKLYAGCRYRVNDRVVLTDKTITYDKTGNVSVVGICREYSEMGINEIWPESDNPFLVSLVYGAVPGSIINCTTNYVEPMVLVELC